MLDLLLPILSVALLGYLVFILVRAYKPEWFRKPIVTASGFTDTEGFAQNAMGPPVASQINMPPQAIPSPAPPTRGYEIAEPDRTMSPGSPNPPNAQDSSTAATMSPEVAPVDPLHDYNMEAPIKDSMRHPELSFGPGMDNSGVKKAAASGVMNKGALSSESPFSPEFAQNGGQFMGAVTANDLNADDTYATA